MLGVRMLQAAANKSAGGDPHWSNVVSLLHFDGTDGSTTFTDETGKTWTANGNAQIDTAQSKFGGASGYFDGTGDYISVSSGMSLAGDFTIEAFVRPAAYNNHFSIYDSRTSGLANGFLMYINKTNNHVEVEYRNGGTWSAGPVSTTALALNTWVHVALARQGQVSKLYIGGIEEGSVDSGSVFNFSNGAARVGAVANADADWAANGHIDALRITSGVARYTANFTPPSAPFPNG